MTIIHYLSLFSHKALSTPAFPMTKNTAFHFYEVKVLMNRLEIDWVSGTNWNYLSHLFYSQRE